MVHVVLLKNIGKNDIDVVGEKAALLGEVFSIAPVPQGFVLETSAFQRFVSLERENIKGILGDGSIDDEEKADRISKMIESIDFPKDVHKEIVDAYENLSVDYRTVESAYDLVKTKSQTPVVVRSNMFLEKDESFVESAFEINVMGADALIKAIKLCWVDFFNEEVLEFLTSENIDFDDIKIIVLVQKMVYTHKSGIVYTVNPDTNDEDEIAIEACWGVDDYFLLDENEPNFYVVDKQSLDIKERGVEPQGYAYLIDKKTGEPVKKIIPENEREIKALKDEEIKLIANIAKKIEEKLGDDLEIEFIIEKDKAYITQIDFMEEEDEGEEYEEANEEEPEGEVVEEIEEPEEVEEGGYYDHEDAEKELEIGEADFEAELKELISRYIAINPNLREALELMESDILELYKRLKK